MSPQSSEAACCPSSPGEAPRDATVSCVILDLDGTLIDTETLVKEVSQEIVESFGRTWTGEGEEQRLGKRPVEGYQTLVDQYNLPITGEEFYSRASALLLTRWNRAKALPGADRLLRYLKKHEIPTALASSSPRVNITMKLAYHPEWQQLLGVSVAGDEVQQGKPDPEIFLKASKLLGHDPATCLVVEDSPAGAEAGKRAGMKVLVVPSLPPKSSRSLYTAIGPEADAETGDDAYLASLLDLRPERWGLPPFDDWLGGALPVEAWRVGGPVVKGFGRGSKMLGIPTANLPAESIAREMAGQVCGIYLGWAALASKGIHKMVMSVGWNPYFGNKEKTVEPWLLHEFEEDFYGEELRLVVVGYIRPEANFPSLEALVARIRRDGEIASTALDMEPFAKYKVDPYLSAIATV